MQKNRFEVLYVAGGDDMVPSISPNEKLLLERVSPERINLGDIIVFRRGVLIAHRVMERIHMRKRYFFLTKGDRCLFLDSPVTDVSVVGRIVGKSTHIPPLFRRSVALRLLLLSYLANAFFSGRFSRCYLFLLKTVSRTVL